MAENGGGFDPATTPSMAPPEGMTSNFVDPPSLAYIPRATMYTALPLMMLFLCLRLYSRARVGFKFGADDFVCVAAAASIIAWFALFLTKLDQFYYGRHRWDYPMSGINDLFVNLNLGTTLMYPTCAMLTKAALLTLYLRIFHTAYLANRAIYLCLGTVTLFYLISVIYLVIRCSPRPGSGEGILYTMNDCAWDTAVLVFVHGVFGTVSDFVILLIPMSLVLPLSLPRNRKLAVAATFFTGFLAVVCSGVSTWYRYKMMHNRSPDFTWEPITPEVLAIVEITVGHICGSLPTLPPLFVSFRNSSRGQFVIRHLLSLRNTPRNDAEAKSPATSSEQVAKHQQLPEIPGGQLTDLRSFMQRVSPSQRLKRWASNREVNKEATDASQEVQLFDEADVVDLDYHQHLRNNVRSPA
ncbi:hypothetical protein B0T22DRAFT_535940 [Podospora appendiculata]|uniref:Rhodopsin domain-containing protein n=1 Tax=Podospora appendiculata TaxID=314037 RepID=A0AAE0XA75_9PEZI|nr:hypothetical protein B0T22DRAFT_535940 [Podospora appendiculata]